MNQRKCLKCGHQTSYEAVPPSACESCGAIYRKVEEALRSGPPSQSNEPSRPAAKRPTARDNSVKAYAASMREDSLYPTWRELVKWSTWVWYIIAAVLVIGGAMALAGGGVKSGIGAIFGAVVVIIMARVWRELSLMLADLADAAVRQASNSERLTE